jgi:hypothetical protein
VLRKVKTAWSLFPVVFASNRHSGEGRNPGKPQGLKNSLDPGSSFQVTDWIDFIETLQDLKTMIKGGKKW